MRPLFLAAALGAAACSSANHGAAPAQPGPARPEPVEGRPADPPPPALRLPGDVRPTQYALELTIVPEEPVATGRVTIAAEVVRPTRVVWLNATDLKVTRATIDGRPARVIPGGDDFVGLTLDAELAPGPHPIEVAWTGAIDPQRSRGIYSEKEGDDRYVYTFFEPIDARRAFPCFDEPAYKVPWQLTFHVKKDHVALANAPVVRETHEPGGMKRVELAVSRPIPSYLVAFVVGPFEVIDGGTAGRVKTPVRFVIPKGRAGELRWAQQVTPRVVAALEDYFDMDYPYGKLDVAVVPRYWGTMEHPGIVAMGQPLTLIRPDQETRSRKQSYANILAHELAHYWFGDLVTMAWWDDTWLNEALGEWMDMIITDGVEPSWRFRDRRIEIATAAMDSDEAIATRAIRQPVTTREGIGASFDNGITYFKGASVFRMFEAAVGPEAWRDAMRTYMRRHQWANATADDLLSLVRDQLDPWTSDALRSFLEQPGVPRIEAKVSCRPGEPPRLALTQRRSLPAGTQDLVEGRAWKLPVCVRYGDRTAHRTCTRLDGPEASIALEGGCPTWVIANADATGYYRSVIDPKTARALLSPSSPIARAARPTAAEKMMLVADLRAMIDRDELAFDQLLELVPLVAADPDEKVASWAFEAASFRADALDDALYGKARRYLDRTFGPPARKLGWTRGRNDSDERHELRRAFVSAVAERDPVLGKQAEQLAERWLVDRTGAADDLVPGILRTAARRGDQARFDRMLAAARSARDRNEKQRLLGALGAFRDPAIAKQALELVRGTEFDLRESSGILYGVLFGRETRALGVAFVTAHLDELLARLRDDEAAGLLGALAGGFCTKPERDAISALVAPRAARYSGAETSVRRGLEQSQQCIATLERQLPALRRVLDK